MAIQGRVVFHYYYYWCILNSNLIICFRYSYFFLSVSLLSAARLLAGSVLVGYSCQQHQTLPLKQYRVGPPVLVKFSGGERPIRTVQRESAPSAKSRAADQAYQSTVLIGAAVRCAAKPQVLASSGICRSAKTIVLLL